MVRGEAASSGCGALGQAGPSFTLCPLVTARMQEAELWSLLGSHLRSQGGPYPRVIVKTRESEGPCGF